MNRKDVRTSHDAVACDVCGRTLLRGEHAETYLAGASRRQVCELCTARATHQGWIRESASLEMTGGGHDRPERRPLRGRLRARYGRDRRTREAADGGTGRGGGRGVRAGGAWLRSRPPHPRGSDQRRDEGGACGRAVQRQRPSAHGRRGGAVAGRSGRHRPARRRRQPGRDRRRLGAVLVPLRGRSRGGARRGARGRDRATS